MQLNWCCFCVCVYCTIALRAMCYEFQLHIRCNRQMFGETVEFTYQFTIFMEKSTARKRSVCQFQSRPFVANLKCKIIPFLSLSIRVFGRIQLSIFCAYSLLPEFDIRNVRWRACTHSLPDQIMSFTLKITPHSRTMETHFSLSLEFNCLCFYWILWSAHNMTSFYYHRYCGCCHFLFAVSFSNMRIEFRECVYARAYASWCSYLFYSAH